MRLHIEKAVYGGAGLAHQTEGEGAGTPWFQPVTLPTAESSKPSEFHQQLQSELAFWSQTAKAMPKLVIGNK